MRTSIAGTDWTLTCDQEKIDVTWGQDTLDPKWRATDENGHEHYYEHGYPTLDFVVEAEHWCNGDEGYGRHDPHMCTDEGHYECRICRAVVEPGIIRGGAPQYIPGMRSWTLKGTTTQGAEVEVYITDDEAQTVIDGQDEAARQILDAAQESGERVLSMTWAFGPR